MRFKISGIGALGLVAALALAGWSGWWWVASTAQQAAVDGWLAERRAAGWAADASSVSVAGYPNRLDLTLTGLTLADPAAGWAWDVPRTQVNQLSYRPDQAIIVFPPRQVLSIPGATLAVTADDLRASAGLRPAARLGLRRAVLTGKGVALAASGSARSASGGDWTAAADHALIALREAEAPEPGDGAHAYDVSLSAQELRLPGPLRALLGLGAALPETARSLQIDATAGFAEALDLDALEGGGPRLTALRLRPSELIWGPLGLRAAGQVSVDPEGWPTGELSLRAENWRAALEAAINAGLMPRGTEDAVRGAMEVIAFLAARGEGLEASLRFENRRMYLGPVPIGAAPRLGR
jgi:hypothetical protein